MVGVVAAAAESAAAASTGATTTATSAADGTAPAAAAGGALMAGIAGGRSLTGAGAGSRCCAGIVLADIIIAGGGEIGRHAAQIDGIALAARGDLDRLAGILAHRLGAAAGRHI